ncbi:hypothetical protein GQ600_23711 [Phytophthora cactorum]|nr:hypothetical protein GQ600_23711 [Phytophthora cactorum]
MGLSGRRGRKLLLLFRARLRSLKIAKHVEDHLCLLQKQWKASELILATGSGIEENTDAIKNEHNHYNTCPAIRAALRALFCRVKGHIGCKEEACASEINAESNRRRVLRNRPGEDRRRTVMSLLHFLTRRGVCLRFGFDNFDNFDSSKQIGKKRVNAFETESERLDKRARDEITLQKLEWQNLQHTELIELEKSRISARAEDDRQNRELILECAKIFSAALDQKQYSVSIKSITR